MANCVSRLGGTPRSVEPAKNSAIAGENLGGNAAGFGTDDAAAAAVAAIWGAAKAGAAGAAGAAEAEDAATRDRRWGMSAVGAVPGAADVESSRGVEIVARGVLDAEMLGARRGATGVDAARFAAADPGLDARTAAV